MDAPQIVLYRRDLRTADHSALTAAMAAGPTIALYILDDAADGRPLGGAARWWLHQALTRLQGKLERLGVPLILRRGPQNAQVSEVVQQTGAVGLHWSRRYTPWGVETDTALKTWAESAGLTAHSFPGTYLTEPWQVATKQGTPFKVFTRFYKAALARGEPPEPLPEPDPQAPLESVAESDSLDDWNLQPTKPDWAGGLREAWPADGDAAADRLYQFLDDGVADYKQTRNRPDMDGTSALSPYLASGEISPGQIWHAARHAAAAHPEKAGGVEAFLRELVWRDFSASLLYHFPHIADRPFQDKFTGFPWRVDDDALTAWQRGETGYPWVDAGMQQLWHTGWMHNRVRMGVASFLTKHLLLSWQEGEAWFWDTLVDADPSQNITNWQWVAGCGADAAPYFRIFNPISQGEKFDPDGDYLRRWQPDAESYQAGAAGVEPIVEHRAARERALAALGQIKSD